MRLTEAMKLHRKSGMWDRSSLEILWQDIRQAIRTLRNNPGFTALSPASVLPNLASTPITSTRCLRPSLAIVIKLQAARL